MNRRSAIKATGAIAAAAAAFTRLGSAAEAHDLTPSDPTYRFDEYKHFVSKDAKVRQVYQWPNIKNPTIFANVRNGLNGWQFSYDGKPELMRVVVQAYASANAALYDDFIWNKYALGVKLGINDGAAPATRNIFYASTSPAPADEPPSDRNAPYYNDLSIEGLQRRDVLFLI